MRTSTKSVKAAEKRGRGRPRAFDPEVALGQAREVFWDAGYAASSLDELSEAMHINRPSVYAAFGDKRDLYVATVRRYQAQMRAALRPFFEETLTLRQALERIYDVAVTVYSRGAGGGRGCYTVATAVTPSISDPEIRQLLLDWAHESDAAFTRLIHRACQRGELPEGADPTALGQLAVATLHTLAVRARIGAGRAELDGVVAALVRTVCGPEATPARAAPTPARPRRRVR